MLPIALLSIVVLVSACGGGSSTDSADQSTTSSTGIITTIPPVSSVPSIEPADSPDATGCVELGLLLPASDLVPRRTDSWPNERQRVLVDAQLQEQTVEALRPVVAVALSERLVVVGAHAAFVVETLLTAESATSAIGTIEGYPERAALSAASSFIDDWREANC